MSSLASSHDSTHSFCCATSHKLAVNKLLHVLSGPRKVYLAKSWNVPSARACSDAQGRTAGAKQVNQVMLYKIRARLYSTLQHVISCSQVEHSEQKSRVQRDWRRYSEASGFKYRDIVLQRRAAQSAAADQSEQLCTEYNWLVGRMHKRRALIGSPSFTYSSNRYEKRKSFINTKHR